MFRCTIAKRRCGIFRSNRPLYQLWGYKQSDMHRLSRQRPWWENAAIFAGLIAFINAASACLYFGNRAYQRWRPTGNEIYITTSIDEKVFSRPDLAVAAVKMMFHHALSDTKTPFGAPIVAPPHLRQEAEELLDFVWKLHTEQPIYSFPDLWSMLTAKALIRLGGPSISVRRGREHVPESTSKEDMLAIVPSLAPEDKRDVLSMKRMLAKQGFSLEHIVALATSARAVGFHEGANFHTTEEVKPRMRRNPSSVGPEKGDFQDPDTIKKCTLDPFVFSNDYCNLLLDYNWKQTGFLKKSSEYRCTENDRNRDIMLLDPFSDNTKDADRRMMEAQARANANFSAQSSKGGDGETGAFGRSGEAQFIPGMEPKEIVAIDEAEMSKRWTEEATSEHLDPCEYTSMMGVDVMLLDDALTRGWLHRFTESELVYYAAVGDVVGIIQERGHNANLLHDVGRIG